MIEFLAHTFDIIGKLMISFTAIMVHHRFLKEHRVDSKVLLEMRKEQRIGIIGITFMLSGYALKLYLMAMNVPVAAY